MMALDQGLLFLREFSRGYVQVCPAYSAGEDLEESFALLGDGGGDVFDNEGVVAQGSGLSQDSGSHCVSPHYSG